MPTYEYRCPEGHDFEVFQKMSDEPVANCPECGAAAERILSGGAGFLFKGSGFYITDYRSDSYRAAAKADAPAGAKEGGGGKKSPGDAGGASSTGSPSTRSPSSGTTSGGSSPGGTGSSQASSSSGSD